MLKDDFFVISIPESVQKKIRAGFYDDDEYHDYYPSGIDEPDYIGGADDLTARSFNYYADHLNRETMCCNCDMQL